MKFRPVIVFTAFLIILLAGLVATYISFQFTSPEAITEKIEKHLADEMHKVDAEAMALLKDLNSNTIKDGNDQPELLNNFFLVYDHGELIYWSNNSFVPAVQIVSDTFSIKLLRASNGDYLVKKLVIDPGKFLIGVVPLHREFKIKNDYLSEQWNKRIFPQGYVNISELTSDKGMLVNVQGINVFKITIPDERSHFNSSARWVALTLLFIAIGLYVFLLYAILPIVVKRYSLESGFFFLTIGLWLIRFIMVEADFPNALITTALFNPQNFASSSYNASLGDLIFNELAVLALCYYLLKSYTHFKFIKPVYKNRLLQIILSVLSVTGILFASLFSFVVIQTLYNNSSITLDISQSLHFDTLRLVAYSIVLVAWGCSFLFTHIFIRLLIAKHNLVLSFSSIAVGIFVFVLVNEYTGQEYVSSLTIGCIHFLMVYWLKLYSSLRKLSYTTFVYLFITIVCFSINGAYAIKHFEVQEKVENQFRFATNFLIDRDYFGEYLLHEAANKIEKDVFIKMRMNSPFSKDIVQQKVRQVFIPTYFNKYDVDIHLFNSSGIPYNNFFDATFSQLINIYDREAFRTDYNDVYFINSPSADITQKYLVIVPINRFMATAGYVVVELSLKKIIPESVYPELLVDNRFQQFYKTQDLSYALFLKKDIVFSSGNFNYEGLFSREWLMHDDLYKDGLQEEGYLHIGQKDGLGRTAVVSSRSYSSFYVLSNFSFLLVLGLFITLLLILVEGFLSYLQGSKLFFSTRIQLFLNVAFFLPLIIVSIITLSLTSRSSKEQLDAEYLSKSKIIGEHVSAYLNDYLTYTNENQIDFKNQLSDLAKLTNLDANVYDPKGVLMATSQPLIFENNLFSVYSNPHAIKKIANGQNIFIETEQVGQLEYFVSYAALKSSRNGELIGILGIPFFQSVNSLDKIQIVIFTNILNIFAGIFIVLLVLSYFVSEWLTFPLRFITQTLKRTSLVKINQPLTWQSDDEIGLMVKEYNNMLYKLSESKVELENTQRERAWREIAQQIAHEIKNPLTPMKLTLQQMERAIQNGNSSIEKTSKSLASLLSQVDILNDIASSFSSFAKMPVPVIQKVELVSLLKRIVTLHSQSGEINIITLHKELWITGDEQLLGRVFSNIILNALQASRPGVQLIVSVTIKTNENRALVIIQDNGNGIPQEIVEQVFIPHFSTKKSGSGLGLAIAKQGIEQMGGSVWFETTVGKGTVFYIEMLLAK